MPQQEKAIRITVAGKQHYLKFDELSAKDAKDFRHETGSSLATVFLEGTVDLDIIAGLLWLERRKTNPKVTYDSIASTLTYGTEIEVHDGDD